MLVPPDPKSVEMDALLRDGITTHFGLDLSFEVHPMDVLVLGAPNGIVGIGPPGGGAMSLWGTFALDEPVVPDMDEVREAFEQRVKAVPGTKMSAAPPGELGVSGTGTVELLRDMLEHMQDRLVVDQTGDEGARIDSRSAVPTSFDPAVLHVVSMWRAAKRPALSDAVA